MAHAWIDISVPLEETTPVWPGDPPVRIQRVAAIENGAANNTSAGSLCFHAGTHVDAPLHYFDGAQPIDRMPLDAAIGPARVIGISDHESIKRAELLKHDPRRGDRLLLKTRNSALWRSPGFASNYVHLTRDAAEMLADRGIRVLGIDYISVGGPDEEGDEVHRLLLRAGIWLIEGLDLSGVLPGKFTLVCLPLRILGSDGAPARAIVRPA
jgi:arylformamidase